MIRFKKLSLLLFKISGRKHPFVKQYKHKHKKTTYLFIKTRLNFLSQTKGSECQFKIELICFSAECCRRHPDSRCSPRRAARAGPIPLRLRLRGRRLQCGRPLSSTPGLNWNNLFYEIIDIEINCHTVKLGYNDELGTSNFWLLQPGFVMAS